MRAAVVAIGIALAGATLVAGPAPAGQAGQAGGSGGTEAQLPVCGGPGWTYVGSNGVYVGFCYDPPDGADPAVVYDPSDPSGPCLHVHGGFEGRTDVCADIDSLVGPWGPCVFPLDGSGGVYVSACWDGRTNSGDPDAEVFVNGSGWPCVRVEQAGFEGHVDVCVSAVDARVISA